MEITKMHKKYLTCFAPDGKEKPCNLYTKRWGWLIRIKNKILNKGEILWIYTKHLWDGN